MNNTLGKILLGATLGYVILFVGSCNGPSLGIRATIAGYDGLTIGKWGDPDRPAYVKWRDQRRSAETAVADALPDKTTDARTFLHDNLRSAEAIRDMRDAERQVHAVAEGRTLQERPDAAVDADNVYWQPIECFNTATERVTPCEFSRGQIIVPRGIVYSSIIKDVRTQQLVPIGPCGLPGLVSTSKPLIRDLPFYALVARIRRADNTYSKPFMLCGDYVVTEPGTMEAVVNGNYWDRFDNPHMEWFKEQNTESFRLRIKNVPTPTSRSKEEQQHSPATKNVAGGNLKILWAEP